MNARSQRPLLPRWLLILSGIILVAGVVMGARHGGLQGMMHSVGYAVCHQITVRTFIFGDRAMPLCARCSGQYLGAMAGFVLALVWGRIRASQLPSRGIVLTLVIFLAVWAFDGINSYIYLLTGEPFIYLPHNLLRLITGMLQGIAVSMFFLPFFNRAFWRSPDPRPVLRGWRDLAVLLLLAAALTLAVNSRWPALYYPLALISSLGVFLLLSLVGVLFTMLAFKAENTAETWGDFLRFLLPGMAFAILLIIAIDALRAWTEATLDNTF